MNWFGKSSLIAAITMMANHVASPACAQDDVVILWTASGRDGAPCGDVGACDIANGFACVGEHCWPAGKAGETCRPTDHPRGRGCDVGLACEESICVPAGGLDEPCLPCDENDDMSLCLLDRCDYLLGCDQSTFRCIPAGGEEQPCREEPNWQIRTCDDGTQCIASTCIAVGGDGERCTTNGYCNFGLFCEAADGDSFCTIQPRGRVSLEDTPDDTQCVDDVAAQFGALALRGSYSLRFSFDAREGDRLPPYGHKVADFDTDIIDRNRDHMQGICKLPGADDKYIFTRNADDDDEGPAGIMIADRSRARFLYDVNAAHPGGLSMFGHTVAVAVEFGRFTYESCGAFGCVLNIVQDVGWIDFWRYQPENVSDPLAHVHTFRTSDLPGNGDRPSSVAYTQANGGLLFVLGRASNEGWLLQGSTPFQESIPSTWRLLQHFPSMSDSVVGGVWREFQNVYFVTECSGELFMVATVREPGVGNSNYADLWHLEATARGHYLFRKIKSWKPYFDDFYCNARYAANPIVRNGELSFVCSGALTNAGGDLGVAEIRP